MIFQFFGLRKSHSQKIVQQARSAPGSEVRGSEHAPRRLYMGCETEEGTKLNILWEKKSRGRQIQGSGPAVVLAVSATGLGMYLQLSKKNLVQKLGFRNFFTTFVRDGHYFCSFP